MPVLDRISEGLARTTGRIRVIGHSDNIPVRRNGRLASNFELSQAREVDVNNTADGRALNRRVEVIVMQRQGRES